MLQQSFKQLLLIIIIQIELDAVQAQNIKMGPAQKNLIWMWLLKFFFLLLFENKYITAVAIPEEGLSLWNIWLI